MEKVVITEKKDGIFEVKLNRPDIRNAIDEDVMDQFKQFMTFVKSNKHVKAAVIIGEGQQAFCSGGDLSVFHQLKTKDEAYKMLSKMGTILYEWMMLPVPTFAVLNGTAVGGGCEIATACDFRIAKKGIKIGFIQGTLAITTGWGGASMLLKKLPYDKALTMLMSAKRYSSEEAFELGFVSKIVAENNFYQESYQYIRETIRSNKEVLRAYKQIKISEWEKGLKQKMMQEIDRCAELWEKEEHLQAVKQFLNS
ncbi:enoyl-CoA hydratase/isomerase family protein [Aeribacillus alveayuensis]|uniref:Enoyl-CoA hydratase/carnithine racemase n=1 Tax=Aeribacillus alveayuensis TaxID=279215 RepID=A0ABT9VKW3_9BACI|nr:enoyl-CoA hydratase/carnithine racemase [Bacillus alveayuensis]